MDLNHVKYDKKERVAYVTLNRPEVLNALNAGTISDLERVFQEEVEQNGMLGRRLHGSHEVLA